MIERLRPGHPVYTRVESEYPDLLTMFLTWVAMKDAHRMAFDVNVEFRDRSADDPKNPRLKTAWSDTSRMATIVGSATSEVENVLVWMLRHKSVEQPYAWMQTLYYELEKEAEAEDGEAA